MIDLVTNERTVKQRICLFSVFYIDFARILPSNSEIIDYRPEMSKKN